jgi:hypothetical protein
MIWRPLVQPDEVGRVFARIDDRSRPAYPGLALVMVAARAVTNVCDAALTVE